MTLLRKNLLNRALHIIPSEQFQYIKYLGAAINDFGISIPSYAEPVTIQGSVQAVENALYQQMGLDLEKNYRYFYCAQDIRGNAENPQPDRFYYDNKIWEVVKNSQWFTYDGWCGVVAVWLKDEDIPDAGENPND